MSGGFYGADVAELRALGDRIDRAAEEIERAGRLLSQAIATTIQWQGPDASTFRSDWSGSHHLGIMTAVGALKAAAASVRLNADQQQTASRPDQDAVGVLRDIASGLREAVLTALGGEGEGSLPRPSSGSDPERASEWWNALSPEQQARVIAERPAWIGNTDGIPAWARDQANRNLIDEHRSALEAERERLTEALSGKFLARFGLEGLLTNEDRQLEIVQAKLRALDEIEECLARGDRQLLVLDPSDGPQLKAAIAVGDVDTADHVAVFTPGFQSNVQDSMGPSDTSMAALKSRAELEARRFGAGGSVATVSWLGYEAPQTNEVLTYGRSVGGSHLAEKGAGDLSLFYRGINASRDVDPHMTALGHSYGSLTTGIALRTDTGVDDAALFGSPGIGTDDVSDLRVPQGHVYLLEAPKDPVADLGRFGGDPSRIEGIQNLSADDALVDGRWLAESGGLLWHTEYLKHGTTSQYNIAVVIAGMPHRAVRE